MRINIGQRMNLFSIDAFNQSIHRKTQEKGESTLLPRKDIVTISPTGKASGGLYRYVNPIELSEEGQTYLQDQIKNGTRGVLSTEKLVVKRDEQEAEYYRIIENSDDGFHMPTMDLLLRGTYSEYLNETYKKGKDPDEDVYEYIVNMYVDSFMKAYQDIYNDIVTGYENGTREVWTQNFDEGADYIEFELEGENYRFHKLTMEEELARLDQAYEKAAKDVADKANSMIDTQKMLEKVIPEYREKMRQIGAWRAGIDISEVGESLETMAERVKNKISMGRERAEKINIFEMLVEARKNWLNTGLTAM